MNKKNTQTTVEKKIYSYLKSITDIALREKMKGSIVVSGGCIASLLKGQEVNDFDLYITDMDVLVEIAKYYNIDCNDGRKRIDYIKEYRRNEGMEYSEDWDVLSDGIRNNSEAAVFLRTLKENQIKLSVAGAGEAIKHPKPPEGQELPEYRPVFVSQNAISLSDDIQIVFRFSGSVEQIHKTFDFIHATNYFTMEDGLVLNEKALLSLLTDTLVYQGSYYPLTSIIRMKKFIIRGWRINAGEILKIMFQISQLDLLDLDVLEEQLIGVDVAYFSALINTLRGKDGVTEESLREEIEKLFS